MTMADFVPFIVDLSEGTCTCKTADTGFFKDIKP